MMGGYGDRLKSKKSKFSNYITATVEHFKTVTALNGTKCIKLSEAWLGYMRSRDFLGRIGPSSSILNRLAENQRNVVNSLILLFERFTEFSDQPHVSLSRI